METQSLGLKIIQSYFNAFNAGQTEKMLSYLHEDVEHEINQDKK